MSERLVIYNSLTKKKEHFKAINPSFVGIYVCGPTVYSKSHLGHARSAVTFDVVRRYLEYLQYKVRYVSNITDVGHLERDLDDGMDKIEKQAILEQLSPMEVAQYYTVNHHKNLAQLNVLPAHIEPCASGHILEQISLINKILEHGYGYVIDGSVYFDLEKYNQNFNYTILSNRVLDQMLSGTRLLANQQGKKQAQDFALWKKASPRHIMAWPSPWGMGFPGWHIECSAMSTKYLGCPFDIHGGGLDLMFPHHECEIAQTQAGLHSKLANYWMHNNLVLIDGVKMGKSLNNCIVLDELFSGNHDFLDQAYSPMVLRCCILQSHYRSPLSISLNVLKSARKCYKKLINGLYILDLIGNDYNRHDQASAILDQEIDQLCEQCYKAMDDDFNTPKVLSYLFKLLKKINSIHNGHITVGQQLSAKAFYRLKDTYTTLVTKILGLKEEMPLEARRSINAMMQLYRRAKDENNEGQIIFIRSLLEQMDLVIQDHPKGSYWLHQVH